MQLYEYAAKDVMRGCKILYIHGFASSGDNGTVHALRLLLPSAEIIAPDVPEHPADAMSMLHGIVESENPDLIIGTSMGGMYAEQLHGRRRILVNPAFHLADTLLKNNGLGRQEYHNVRKDGQTSFMVTKGLLEEYRECSSHCFESEGLTVDVEHPAEGGFTDEQNLVYGLFGTRDTMVDTYDEFASHYPNAIHFDGEHYLNDSALLHSVMPLIRRISDEIGGVRRKTLLVSLEDVLMDVRTGRRKGLEIKGFDTVGSGIGAFVRLSESYDTYIVASYPYNRAEVVPHLKSWIEDHVGVYAWNRVIFTNRKDLVLGDYLIDRYPERYGNEAFMGTLIGFGEDPFRTWEDVVEFFGRLGGQ